MTNLQKQRQLYYLGYLSSEDEVDGFLGPNSQAATRAMQAQLGIPADGLFGPDTVRRSIELIRSLQQRLTGCAQDGLAGPETMAATRVYQRSQGLADTGLADEKTREYLLAQAAPTDFWADIRYFTRQELRCKCGGRYCGGFPAEPREDLVRLAEAAREHFGRPAHVVSALRCTTWNALSGGVANSQHMYGEAMDLRIDGVSGQQLYEYFRSRSGVRYCYQINDTNVHFDVPKGVR